MNVKRVKSILLGFTLLSALYLLDHWIFSKWFGIAYWEWYLKNGTTIGLVTAIVTKVWGDMLDNHTGLISSHPLDYVGSCAQLIGLPVYVMGTQLKESVLNDQRPRSAAFLHLAGLCQLGQTEFVRTDRPSFGNLLRWCLLLRCPACGKSSILKAPFKIKDHCTSCRVIFQREQGFFVGAILVNVVTTELVILLAYLASLPFISVNYQIVLALLFVIAVVFPIAFYHHSWSIWLTFDHLVEGLSKI